MKELLLISILLALFAFGYFEMKKIDRFIEENKRLICQEEEKEEGCAREERIPLTGELTSGKCRALW